ncbi:MAG: sulfite exporter TauE/SafE family protein [Candidatus Omnitrophica bacterium]|nr:sulfite exporter TauE/SafE family protein [Candidatus Omnitrophota bacterium]MDD5671261.1 sulfite exporter TauE/SafE family protein [Candidatus Omnitrophota bacterium]
MISPSVLIFVSIIAGFVGALSGMGGGIILIPALTFFGLDIKQAIALSMISVIATSSGAASAYARDHLTNLKVGMFLEMFTMMGALAGASITVVSGQRFLFLIFGMVLLLSWGMSLVQYRAVWKPASRQDRFSQWLELEGKYYDQTEHRVVEYKAVRAPIGGVLMFIAGMIAGLLGIGAGAVKVLIHDLIMKLPPKVSTTTSNLIIGVTALAGTGVYLSAGFIRPGLAALVILGVVIGSFLGTRLFVRLSNQAVRWFFLVVLLALGVQMIWRGIRGVA